MPKGLTLMVSSSSHREAFVQCMLGLVTCSEELHVGVHLMAGHERFHFLQFQKRREQVDPVQRKSCVDLLCFLRILSTGTAFKNVFKPLGSVWRKRQHIMLEYCCGYECCEKGAGLEPKSKH